MPWLNVPYIQQTETGWCLPACAAMVAALQTSHEVTSAAHLPAACARRAGLGERAATLLRLEGFARSVAARARGLGSDLAGFGGAEHLEGDVSQTLWASIRDVAPLLGASDAPLWRISTAPTIGPQLVAALRGEVVHCRHHRGRGLPCGPGEILA